MCVCACAHTCPRHAVEAAHVNVKKEKQKQLSSQPTPAQTVTPVPTAVVAGPAEKPFVSVPYIPANPMTGAPAAVTDVPRCDAWHAFVPHHMHEVPWPCARCLCSAYGCTSLSAHIQSAMMFL